MHARADAASVSLIQFGKETEFACVVMRPKPVLNDRGKARSSMQETKLKRLFTLLQTRRYLVNNEAENMPAVNVKASSAIFLSSVMDVCCDYVAV